MHPFRAFISLYTEISDHDWSIIAPHLQHKIIQQNRIILKQGEICSCLYFLENGSFRYFLNKNSEQNSIHFINSPALFTSGESFAKQTPSSFGIQSLDESSIWIIKSEDAHSFLELPSWNKFLKTYFAKNNK